MPSFDVVSKVEWSEVTNALDQASREVAQRFDFRGTDTELERVEQGVMVRAASEERARAAIDVFQQKLVRRKVSLKHLLVKDPDTGPKGSSRILIEIREGIEQDKARQIVKLIKDRKLKVQASIQEQSVRVSGKKKDDLQEVVQMLRLADELDLDLQFINFRE